MAGQLPIKTVNIKGKDYIDVAERVRLVHLDDSNTFAIIESVPFIFNDRFLWKAIIEVGGTRYIGHAEIHFNMSKSLPEGTNPFECAETSAIGRALGFAGFGSVQSIASLDEVVAALLLQGAEMKTSHNPAPQRPAPAAPPKPNPAPAPAAKPTPINVEIDAAHKTLFEDYVRVASEAEVHAFLDSTNIKIPTDRWGASEYALVTDTLAKTTITASATVRAKVKAWIDFYGEKPAHALIVRAPIMKGKTLKEMPLTIAIESIRLFQAARFYADILTVYDEKLEYLKVKLQVDSPLDLYLNPKREQDRKALYQHLCQCIHADAEPLKKLSDEFRLEYAEQLQGLITTAKSLKPAA